MNREKLTFGCECEIEVFKHMGRLIYLGSENGKMNFGIKGNIKKIVSPPDTEHNRKYIKIIN